MTLDFSRENPGSNGFTVESICEHIRQALLHQRQMGHLTVGCVARSWTSLEVLFAARRPEDDSFVVYEARKLGRLISERRSNSSVLNAVTELRVDGLISTINSGDAVSATSVYIGSIIMLLLLLTTVVLIAAYKRWPRKHAGPPMKAFFGPSPICLNNVRLPKVNNLSPYDETIVNMDKAQNFQEMKDFGYDKQPYLLKANPLDDLKLGKPVLIPQVPDGYDHSLQCSFEPPLKANGSPQKGEDDVVWC